MKQKKVRNNKKQFKVESARRRGERERDKERGKFRPTLYKKEKRNYEREEMKKYNGRSLNVARRSPAHRSTRVR